MAEFNEFQSQLKALRDKIELEQRDIFHSQEQLKKLDLEKKRVSRIYTSQSDEYENVVKREQRINKVILGKKEGLKSLLNDQQRLIKVFLPFMDPRENIGQLDDTTPLLLFPVRIETRFKTVTNPNGGQNNQLWVRIFPDDCSIDTFDETMSEGEIEKAKAYWGSIWIAGKAANSSVEPFVETKKKGAWRKLMGNFNAGRAYWITGKYQPVNKDEVPIRESETDIILTIPTHNLPLLDQQGALKKYWGQVYLSQNDENKIKSAFNKLVSDLGGDLDLALQLIELYKPQNLKDEPTVSAPKVSVAFLVFEKPELSPSKLTAWSQAAKVRTFPERFVLLAYEGTQTEPVINTIGNIVPDPIIVGPDTRDDIEAVLKEVYGEEEIEGMDEDAKASKYVEYLSENADTKWLFNFDEAVKMGLGFKINLSPEQYKRGFSKLFVIGIKLSADKEEGQNLLEQLFKDHQFGDRGFSILPQGTPTNNTEEKGSGYSVVEDPDEAYERYFGSVVQEDPYSRLTKRDGRWLADLLGIDTDKSALKLAQYYYHTDQLEAGAMHTALWNATLGYYMESMVTPVANDFEIDRLRWFLINYVSGRGKVPAIRIANQPYGILPVSTFRDFKWLGNRRSSIAQTYANDFPFLMKLYNILKTVKSDWSTLLSQVAFVGKSGDAHKILLQALGLHASSVEFDRRVAESLISNANILNYLLQGNVDFEKIEAIYKALGMSLLTHLGYNPGDQNPKIPILEKSFLGKQQDVNKFLIDDNPYSEADPIRAYTEDGKNYIEWLIFNAKNNHKNIKEQKGFKDNKVPVALLYDMLRHAMNLEFGNSGLKLYQRAKIITPQEASVMRMDADFIGIQETNKLVESKWDIIYRQEKQINNDGVLVVDHISNLLKLGTFDPSVNYLKEVLTALEYLKDAPTARLERCFVEHLDCCYYRLDSWLLGFLNLQLDYMRFGGPENEDDPSQGIYLGAYGLVENLKPENKVLSPADIDEDVKPIFDPEEKNDIVVDSKNAGYIHAPSINHGLTAAVLRNAYISTASKEGAEVYKVNLSSERVRLALGIIEGMQQGQSLGALLGYHLERGLHDNNTEELDEYIYELRKVFPIGANRIKITEIKIGKLATDPKIKKRYEEEAKEFEDDKAITKIEARNVVDGLAMLEHIRKVKKETYPFGFEIGVGANKLKAASAKKMDAINAEVQRIMNIRDAVADLAIAESVHQVVQGNYDRAAGALDAYSKGHYPQLPDVVQSNGSGVSLTNRFGLHLPAGISPMVAKTPRGKSAPGINAWLNSIFPASGDIYCEVSFTIPNYGEGPENAPISQFISLKNTGLEPIDLLYLEGVDSEKSLAALDDVILRTLYTGATPPTRLDAKVEIKYTVAPSNKFSFFEIGALISSLKALIVSARPLAASDITLQNEAEESQIGTSFVNPDRISQAKVGLGSAKNLLKTNFIDELSGLIDDESLENSMANSAQILNKIDNLSVQFVNILGNIGLYGLPQSGTGYVFEHKSAIYAGLYKKILDYKLGWDDKTARYNAIISIELPAASTDEEKVFVLQKAEGLISSVYDATFTTPAQLQAIVVAKKANFDVKHSELVTYLATNFTSLKSLISATDTLLIGVEAFDLQSPNTSEAVKQTVVLAEDMLKQAKKLYQLIDANLVKVKGYEDDATVAASAKDKIDLYTKAAKVLFGEEFQLVPEFTFSEEQASELQNCLASQGQLLDYQINVEKNDFPVDDWLYGIARVREKLGAWEDLVQLCEGLKPTLPTMDLVPLQLPYQENDSWLALSYPEGYKIESDKLLYTAYSPGFDPTKAQCGLLVDEWTEVIPNDKETTGMTFHYDRPNCEPPQSMLLVAPSEFTGKWKWDDVVNSLHDTLEMMKFRALEPDQVDQTNYAKFLPATVAAVTASPVTMALNYISKVAIINDDVNK